MTCIFRYLTTALVGLFFALLMNCTPAPKEEKKPLELPDSLVARISSVNKEEGYALIQRYGRLDIPDGSVLYSLGLEGKIANLKVSGERLGQFVAVDIVSGELDIGDGVYLRKIDKKTDLNSNESLEIDQISQ